ncbi:MAG TPA: response regulator [Aggregatilineales bacterium]|nr:response regulator [Aggregatilineales bacterium]
MPTWLAVEDESDLYMVLLGMFEIWGIGGVYFEDGAEAMDWLNKVDNGTFAGQLPELALLDIRLPHYTGVDIALRIRRSPRLANIAIVLMTAYLMNEQEENKMLNLCQADVLIYKPLPELAKFRSILESTIAQRRL